MISTFIGFKLGKKHNFYLIVPHLLLYMMQNFGKSEFVGLQSAVFIGKDKGDGHQVERRFSTKVIVTKLKEGLVLRW